MEQPSTYSSGRDVIASPSTELRINSAKQSRDCFVAGAPRNDNIMDLGLADYETVRQLQLNYVQCQSEIILLTEHFPVYTCGRATKPHERPVANDIPVVDIERGGGLTWHGPGQIVGYPILNLNRRRLSIPQYLRRLENALIGALAEEGIEARYRPECLAGVWIGEKKVASIGIAVRHWVTFHGFALNVDCDLAPFKQTMPCGMPGDKVTSLRDAGFNVAKEKLRGRIAENLLQVFF